MSTTTLVRAALLALIGAAAIEARPQLIRSVNRRSDPVEQASNLWSLDDPKSMPQEDVGGNSMANAFLGEENLLQDSAWQEVNLLQDSEMMSKSQKKHVRHTAEALTQEASDSTEPIDLDHDAEIALKEKETRQTGGSQASSGHSSFTAEEPFLRKVSADTAMPIRWAPDGQSSGYCLRGEPASVASDNPHLMIWRCDDTPHTVQMEWILPTAEKAHGQIKWAPDQTQCLYVRNGWEGNENPVSLNSCDDSAKQGAMNFTISTPATSGFSYIAYGKDHTAQNSNPTHCLDVHDPIISPRHVPGNTLDLWDCSANPMWQIY